MSFIRSLAADLRERQVLPAVVLLAILAVGIPVFAALALSGSSKPVPVAPPPVDAAPPAGSLPPGQELAIMQTAPATASTVYNGHEPNPFRAPATGGGAGSSSSGTSNAGGTTTTGSTSPSQGSTSSTGSTSPNSSGSRPSTTTTGNGGGKLASNQAYLVDASSTYGAQADVLDNLQRLTPLPANATPEIVYLGVLRGGRKAVFLLTAAVDAKLSLSGPVVCVPSATNCQVAELGPKATVTLKPNGSDPSVLPFAFEVNAIRAKTFGSDAEALHARRTASMTGEQTVAQSGVAALAHFFYALGIGVVIHVKHPANAFTGAAGATGVSGITGATVDIGVASAAAGTSLQSATG